MQRVFESSTLSPVPSVGASNQCLRAREEVLGVPLHDELVLYDGRSGHTYVLNPTGARIWSLCDGTRPLASLCSVLADDYGLSPRHAASDVEDLVDALQRADLLDRP
ncbi:MAG: HPr-rel-A system PqqD family peptide chaperone [Chloroflexi bacterium]|nr:HPr-rel-A system PqqD family peptide chaperone [Chloroflexota bacterium]